MAEVEFPEPRGGESDPSALFVRYLRFYRETAIAKVASLEPDQQRMSRLPSGWTPLELLNHLLFMEQRWFVWGFLGEDVDDPWGDGEEAWAIGDDVTVDDLARRLREQGDRVAELLRRHRLDEVAPPGPRFESDPPALAGICFHVLQEYARHTGHLDVATELAGGHTGE